MAKEKIALGLIISVFFLLMIFLLEVDIYILHRIINPPNTACNFDNECAPKAHPLDNAVCANVSWEASSYTGLYGQIFDRAVVRLEPMVCKCENYRCVLP